MRTVSQILTAGIAINAFSLLIYALTFNLRDRVARSFAVILACVAIGFTAEAIAGSDTVASEVNFWLRLQWVGILFLPAAYLHFSDALLATTGRPSRGKRRWAVRCTYLISLAGIILLPTSLLLGPVIMDQPPAPHLESTLLADLFVVYYVFIMCLSWFNFYRALRRTITPTSRRRLTYLITGALAPALGSFPYLLYSSTFASQHSLIFWTIAVVANLFIGGLMILMAYAVAFFGVSWPDRVVKSRLFKWIMRGPVTASFALGLTTIVRRTGVVFGQTYTALVPITMVAAILVAEHMISLFSPLWEKVLFYGKDRKDLELLHSLEDRVLTQNDLRQFLETILAAVCDRLQAPGAYVAALNVKDLELVVSIGKTRFNDPDLSSELFRMVSQHEDLPDLFQWGDDYLLPLLNGIENGAQEESKDGHLQGKELLGLLGISGVGKQELDEEQLQALSVMAHRTALALHDRRIQNKIFQSIQTLTPQMDLIQRMRATGRYDAGELPGNETQSAPEEVVQWVKEALTHYWGGPKLTESPLMRLQVVQDEVKNHEGNYPNALRAILRNAIDQVRPEGERRFTGEWILYNILDMKFLEGRKVREVALRLALSEADLYRKQRIAIEAVSKAILDKEALARVQEAEPRSEPLN
ncbi:MAG TPA: histidine kinase N-terminal 7TM domain-containing protein [Anaerolineaceae bacterium]|nr:histidine kinase N-terminal 7TM domain-containing protein [Anaerolineaceae bacterium]